jgi:deazaflavin-dependent oxidoreductase (nitroreductase family)
MESSLDALRSLPPKQFCYLTTTGRVSGKPHTIELWFAAAPGDRSLYILAGGGHRSDWVKNIEKDPGVSIRIGDMALDGKGRIVESEEEKLAARKLVVAKYYHREYNPNGGWEATALPVAIDLQT